MLISKYEKEELLENFGDIIDELSNSASEKIDISLDTLWSLDDKKEINENELLLNILIDDEIVKTVDIAIDIDRRCSDLDHSHILPLFFLKNQLKSLISGIEESIEKNMTFISDEPELVEKVKEVMNGNLGIKEYNKWEKKVYYKGTIGD
jgi:hypothetical protein